MIALGTAAVHVNAALQCGPTCPQPLWWLLPFGTAWLFLGRVALAAPLLAALGREGPAARLLTALLFASGATLGLAGAPGLRSNNGMRDWMLLTVATFVAMGIAFGWLGWRTWQDATTRAP